MIRMFPSKHFEAVRGMNRLLVVSMIIVVWFSSMADSEQAAVLQMNRIRITLTEHVVDERMYQVVLETKCIST